MILSLKNIILVYSQEQSGVGLIQPVREGDEETIETGPDDNKDG